MNVSAKNGRNFLEPYPSWFLACCQFSDDCRVDIARSARGETDFSQTPNVSKALYVVVTTRKASEAL